ncbi:MAG: competence/damage-inducible protein A, partial [Aeromonas sp.]
RAGAEGVPLRLCADGQQFDQILRTTHADPQSRRKILAFAALDMLRRHLLGEPVLGDYRTLTRTR